MLGSISRKLKGRGGREIVALILLNLVYPLAQFMPAAARARRADSQFDRRWGTETSQRANLSSLTVDQDRARHGVRYQASDSEVLERAVASLGVDPGAYGLVDYGGGKGRVVMLASGLGFEPAVSVEFAPELCAAARDNIARFVAAGGAAKPATVVQCDAASFDPPAGPLIAYFYNPFGPAVLKDVIARLEARADDTRVIYVDPRHAELFTETGRWLDAGGWDGVALYSKVPGA
jgi:hypothetical protein